MEITLYMLIVMLAGGEKRVVKDFYDVAACERYVTSVRRNVMGAQIVYYRCDPYWARPVVIAR